MSSRYKDDERAIRRIITDNVFSTDPDKKVSLIVYYKNKKTSNMVMKNNPAPVSRDPLKRTNVIYHFKCLVQDCPDSYVGMTSMKLSKRISCHVQEGAIIKHYLEEHRRPPTRNDLISSIKIIGSAPDNRRLRILEALHILSVKPSLNVTQETFLLPTNIRQTLPTHPTENDNPNNDLQRRPNSQEQEQEEPPESPVRGPILRRSQRLRQNRPR